MGSVTTGQFSPPSVSTGTPSTSTSTGTSAVASLTNLLNIFVFRQDINLGATIQALESDGTLQVLAEPNLLTANGKQGSFLAGGEFPFPVVQGVAGGGAGSAISIQFKEYGIRLNFIPTITPRGTIRLQVAPEVSALDFANGLTLSGFSVPALSVRKAKTEVELSAGQSFAIAGLLDNTETKTFSKIPFIGDVPVLGKFFQSVSKVRNNTELMVIVTPEIVDPAPAGTPLPSLKYPDAFLPLGSPDVIAGSAPNIVKPATPPPTSIPVEQLIESMKPEQPLLDNLTSTPGGGGGGATQSGATMGTAP